MNATQQLAKHFRDVHFGGNWTTVNMSQLLSDITWQEATTSVHQLNTIAALVFHVNYYVNPVSKVLQGEPLNASDTLSYAVPAINSTEEWQALITKALNDAEAFSEEIAKMNESRLFEDFAGSDKYGNYYRNLLGIIEHTHYHLGQIAVIKKILRS